MSSGNMYFSLYQDDKGMIDSERVIRMSYKSITTLQNAVYAHFAKHMPEYITSFSVNLEPYGLIIDFHSDKRRIPGFSIPPLELTLANKPHTVHFDGYYRGGALRKSRKARKGSRKTRRANRH